MTRDGTMDTDTYAIQKILTALSDHQLEATELLRGVESFLFSSPALQEKRENRITVQKFDLALQLIENTNSVLKVLRNAADPALGISRNSLDEVVTLEVVRNSFRSDVVPGNCRPRDPIPVTQQIDIFEPVEPSR